MELSRVFESSFLRLVARELADDWKGLVAMTILAGASDTLLLVVINLSASDANEGTLRFSHLIMFLSMMAIHGLTRYSMLLRSGKAMKNIVCNFRVSISEKLTQVSLQDFERMGKPDIQLVLGRDIGLLSTPSAHFFSVPATLVTTLLSLLYLGMLSFQTFVIVMMLNIGFAIFFIDNRMLVVEAMAEAGQIEGNLFQKISHLSLGFKELKMHRRRRERLLQGHVVPVAQQVRQAQDTINRQLALNFSAGDMYYYCAIGVTLFILPSLQVLVGENAASAVTVMIFLFGNLSEILFAFSILLQYDVAVDRLQKLETSLKRPPPNEQAVEAVQLKASGPFEKLTLKECTFSYHNIEGISSFQVGPFDLELSRGELVFIVGGNGSGKSTFLRMLCGLYLVEHGTLSFNHIPITANNVELYRQQFSTVFTDFHLFDQLYGLEHVTESQVVALQKQFMLDQKTFFNGHQFSTLDLSTGQRKRLALLTALLEERSILILDEVSADQDPEFRRYYYEVLLPQLKAQGKTLLVVSHDDRYFHIADRVLYMNDGTFDLTRTPNPAH